MILIAHITFSWIILLLFFHFETRYPFHSANNHSNQVDTSKTERLPRRHELLITEAVYNGTTKEWLLEAQEQEKLLAYQDKQMEQTKDKKNALEAYVYEVGTR